MTVTVDRSHVARNDAERERLRRLVARLDDAALQRPLPDGWTVAAVLGHLAFWDQRILVLLERWRQEGPDSVPAVYDAHVDWINDAAKPLLLALPPRTAARLALETAEAVDRAVAALPDEIVAANAGPGRRLNLLRAEHRAEHLDEIERRLGL